MVAKSPAIDADTIEREIVARLKAAKLRLRFDKVALQFVAGSKPRWPALFRRGRPSSSQSAPR